MHGPDPKSHRLIIQQRQTCGAHTAWPWRGVGAGSGNPWRGGGGDAERFSSVEQGRDLWHGQNNRGGEGETGGKREGEEEDQSSGVSLR